MPSCATAAPMWCPPSAVNKTELLNRAAQTAVERTLLARALDRAGAGPAGRPRLHRLPLGARSRRRWSGC